MQPCPRQTNEATLSSQRQHQSHWRDDGTCSYCGSLSPDQFFEAISKNAELGPTDKDYKVYVSLPTHWPYPRPRGSAKFYFQHLNELERTRFVELLNARSLQIGYPGYFYRLPFFVTVLAQKEG